MMPPDQVLYEREGVRLVILEVPPDEVCRLAVTSRAQVVIDLDDSRSTEHMQGVSVWMKGKPLKGSRWLVIEFGAPDAV